MKNGNIAFRAIRPNRHISRIKQRVQQIGLDRRHFADKVQKLTDDSIAEADKLLAAKENEIMQV